MPWRARPIAAPFVSCLLLLAAACGGKPAADPNHREVPWTYGPTTGGATAEHVLGTGKKDGKAVAKGWQLRLKDGKQLVVNPYQLAEAHALFGKAMLNIELFDQGEKRIGEVRSPTLTAQTGTFTFDLTETQAKQLQDVVLWYVTP